MYKLYVNEERTIKVEVVNEKTLVFVALRDHTSDMWGPPIKCVQEDLKPYQASTDV